MSALVDVRDADAFTQVFADGLERFGRLDVLVNVAGGTFKADFLDTNTRGWDAIIRTNFGWLLHSTQIAARQMVDQGDGGSIITLTSIEGHRAAPGYAVYAGMKAAVTNFSRTLALELAPHGVRVNCIAPDYTPTEGMPVQHDRARGRRRHPDGPGGHLRRHRWVRPVPRLGSVVLRHRHHHAPGRRRVSRHRAGSTGRVWASGTCRPSRPSASSHRRRGGLADTGRLCFCNPPFTITQCSGGAGEMPLDALRTFNRFELKYVVTKREIARLRPELAAYMERDPYAGSDGRYTLSSLYYDTPARDCFWAKLDGLRFRRKLRIRHYEQPAALLDETPVFVEIKQRVDRVTQKRRAVLPYADALELCDERIIPEHEARDEAVVERSVRARRPPQPRAGVHHDLPA